MPVQGPSTGRLVLASSPLAKSAATQGWPVIAEHSSGWSTHRTVLQVDEPRSLALGASCGLLIGSLSFCRRLALRRRRRVNVVPLRAWDANGCELPPDGQELQFGKGQQDKEKARVALLLNRNAKGVTFKLERRLAELVKEEDCFICCSLQDAEDAVHEILDRGVYKFVACGGGDGTLTSILNLMVREVAARRGKGNPPAVVPALAVLRLGTGNALGYVLGSSRDSTKDLGRLLGDTGNSSSLPTMPAKLLSLQMGQEADGDNETLCFFAGLGFDARMLADYVWIKRKTANSKFAQSWVHSPFGYLLALFFRTLPATVRGEHLFRLKVVNLADEAYYMDPERGDWAVLKSKDSVLYEGRAGIMCTASVPFYGGGFQLFPFAGIPGFVHMRISDIHPLLATLNVISVWKGQFRNKGHVKDFLVKEALVEVDKPVPLQHSGELVGEVEKLHLKVNDDSARLVDFFDFEGSRK